MNISKLDAARVQLDCSIDHFFSGDHICAVTLASAAEDILGALLKSTGEQSSFDFLHEWYQKTYNTSISKENFSRQIANSARNWLKHADKDIDSKYDIMEQDSILILMRAVPCYYKLAKTHSKQMEKFYTYVNDNMRIIDTLFS